MGLCPPEEGPFLIHIEFPYIAGDPEEVWGAAVLFHTPPLYSISFFPSFLLLRVQVEFGGPGILPWFAHPSLHAGLLGTGAHTWDKGK